MGAQESSTVPPPPPVSTHLERGGGRGFSRSRPQFGHDLVDGEDDEDEEDDETHNPFVHQGIAGAGQRCTGKSRARVMQTYVNARKCATISSEKRGVLAIADGRFAASTEVMCVLG